MLLADTAGARAIPLGFESQGLYSNKIIKSRISLMTAIKVSPGYESSQ
jgi:hypothetical protein